ncbi:MAG: hypothetical protein IT454_06225 [Planctomycetes bacterium]|nr:hypothetical protein [Planctomycetota bacterium]
MSADSGVERQRFPRPTAIEWAALAASLFFTLQYSWLLDDAFIYFRYVDNLVYLGRGLVFNEGEYVEGYSSPLWCVLLVPLRALGLDWWLIVRAIGLVCAIGTWALLVRLAREFAPRGAPVTNFPLVYLAFNYAVQSYFTSGVEAPLVQLCAVGYASYVARPTSRTAGVLLGLAPLVRHELALPFVLALAWAWWRTKRFPWLPFALCAATVGAWLGFRVVYYADLLPNTFYLKDEVNWARGLRYLHDTFVVYGTYVLVPAFAALAWFVRPVAGARTAERVVMLAAAALVAVYVAKIGGDPRHYRYLAFPFCLLACSAAGLLEHGSALWNGAARTVGVASTTLALAAACFLMRPRQLTSHPIARDAGHVQVDEINDAQYHRLKPDLSYSPWTLEPDIERLDDAQLDLIWGDSPLLPAGPVDIREEYARWRAAGPGGVQPPIRTEGWCATAWRLFNHTLVHKDGLTDAFLARTSAASWRAAHKKELFPLAVDLVALRTRFGSAPGTFRRAVDASAAQPWIARNVDALERVARKAFNSHALVENLELAFTPLPRVDPGPDPTSTVIPGRDRAEK